MPFPPQLGIRRDSPSAGLILSHLSHPPTSGVVSWSQSLPITDTNNNSLFSKVTESLIFARQIMAQLKRTLPSLPCSWRGREPQFPTRPRKGKRRPLPSVTNTHLKASGVPPLPTGIWDKGIQE